MSELPEKWYIVATEDNYDELEAWRQTVAMSYLNAFGIGNPLLSEHPRDTSYYYGGSVDSLRCDSSYDYYQEITIEQFRQITKPMNTHPEKWYIELTSKNYDEVRAWWLKQVKKSGWPGISLDKTSIVLSKHPKDESHYWSGPESNLNESYPSYQKITLEQFRAITNTKPMPKPEAKTIQIPHSLLIEYYEASTTPQREYLTKHFKLDGTTTDEAIREPHVS